MAFDELVNHKLKSQFSMSHINISKTLPLKKFYLIINLIWDSILWYCLNYGWTHTAQSKRIRGGMPKGEKSEETEGKSRLHPVQQLAKLTACGEGREPRDEFT